MSRTKLTRRPFVPTKKQMGRARCRIEGVFSNYGYMPFESEADLVQVLLDHVRRPSDIGNNSRQQRITLSRALSQLVASGKVIIDHEAKVAGTKASGRARRVKVDRYGPVYQNSGVRAPVLALAS